MTTKVVFRRWGRDIIALLPEIAGADPQYMLIYMRQQLGEAKPGIVGHTKPAKPREYLDLQGELENLGYVVEVRKRITHSMNQKRLEGERSKP